MELQPFNPRYAPLVASWMPDAEAVRQVDPLARGDSTPDLILRWMEAAEHPFMLLPAPEADPVGYGELNWPKRVPGLYARHIVVDPRFRGQGYGWTLLERLGHVAHARFSEDRLHINVQTDLASAIALLHAMGFAELAPITLIPHEGGQHVNALTMGARLPLNPYQHRDQAIPEPGDSPGYGRGLRWT